MSDISNLKAFFKGSVILIISNIFLKAINFFLLPLYTKNLTPQMLGVSDTITSFTGLLFPLLVMGLDSAYSAFYYDKDDGKRSFKVFNTISFLLLFTGGIPIIASFFSEKLSYIFFGRADNYFIVILALVSVALNLFFLPFALEIRMQNKMTIYGIITVVSSLTMILLNIFFVSVIKIGVYALVLSTVIVNGLQLVLFVCCSGKSISIKYVDRSLAKKMLLFSLPLIPSVVAMWILNLSDRYVILYFLGEESVGLYGIGGRFVTLINMIISAVTMAYTTFAYSNLDNPDAKKQFASVLNLMYVTLIAGAFIVSLFSKEIIQLMTADAYIQAYRPIRDMMFAQVIYGISTITSYGIYFKMKSGYALLSTVCAAIFNLVLNIIFIPKYGISAAAATTLLGYLIMFFINYIFSQKLYPCNYGLKCIVINMILLYMVVAVCAESSVITKSVLTVLCAALTLIMFKNRLKELVVLMKSNM